MWAEIHILYIPAVNVSDFTESAAACKFNKRMRVAEMKTSFKFCSHEPLIFLEGLSCFKMAAVHSGLSISRISY